ncbi:MAG: hypothetical protein ABSG99_09335 [Sedimentisphaerales bacterium]
MYSKITKFLLVLYVMSALFLTGCGSSVEVKKLGEKDKGIPYYLPKPYLLITSGISTTEYQEKVTETKTEKPDGTKINEKVTDRTPITPPISKDGYSVRIVYLPDLRTKYGITINPGSGTSDTKITLADGWQFTSLAAITDTKVPETIKATAELVGAVSAAIPKVRGEEEGKKEGKQKFSVRIYEMVLEGDKIKFDIANPVFEWPIPQE